MPVIKLGGCNGSGKTTLARAFLERYKLEPIHTKGKKVFAYGGEPVNGLQPVLLGSYATVCGGMDTISDKDVRLSLIHKYAKPDKLLMFEGLITGKTYGAIGAYSEESQQMGTWLYAFMDTPFDVCVQRVLQRRQAKGNAAPFDPERTMRPTFGSCEGTLRIAGEHGQVTHLVAHRAPVAQELKIMVDAALRLRG